MSMNNNNVKPEWITRAETCQVLGISERQLDRLNARGQGPERRLEPRAASTGGPPVPVYRAVSVARLAEALREPKVVPPEAPVAIRRRQIHTDTNGQPSSSSVVAVAALLDAMAYRQHAPSPPDPEQHRYLAIEEASARSGLSARRLRRHIRAGQLPAIRDLGDYKVQRVALDQFLAAPLPALPAPDRKPKAKGDEIGPFDVIALEAANGE